MRCASLFARRRDTDTASTVFEQLDPQALFQHRDVPADAGLGHAQVRSRGCHSPQSKDGVEACESQQAQSSKILNHRFQIAALFQ